MVNDGIDVHMYTFRYYSGILITQLSPFLSVILSTCLKDCEWLHTWT